MKTPEFAVVGAGPAGITAAIEASRAGVRVALLDENPKPGGQIYRQVEEGFRVIDAESMGADYKRGQKILRELGEAYDKIDYINNATVWGIFDHKRLSYHTGKESSSIAFRKLLFAAGAYDRPVPFPGWTLPGVFTAGGAQRAVKIHRVLPGARILLAGTGPLQLVLADQIIGAGGHIEAILDTGGIPWSSLPRGIWGNWDFLLDGFHYLHHIWKAKIPFFPRHVIVQARGDGRVEEAVIAEVDKDWRPIPHKRRTVKTDCICLGYGLVPSSELTLLAGCDHRYDPKQGGWVPIRGALMETTVPDIYAAGDGSGVSGSKVAMVEGRIAGIAVAHSLGYISSAEANIRLRPYRTLLGRLRRFSTMIQEVIRPRAGLYELADDDTVICRCEEITLKTIQEAMSDNGSGINEVKRMTRSGMGRCQGRMCGPVLYEMMRKISGQDFRNPDFFKPRPPVKPVPLGALASTA